MKLALAGCLLLCAASVASADVRFMGAGNPVLTGPGSRYFDYVRLPDRTILPDDEGGWYLGYHHDADIRLMRLDATGRASFEWPANGRSVFGNLNPYCCLDGPTLVLTASGVIAAVEQYSITAAMRYDAHALLAPGWTTSNQPGRYFYRVSWSSRQVDAVTDGLDGAFLVANFAPFSTSYTTQTVAVTRIAPNGAFVLPWAEGFPYELSAKGALYGKPAMTSDGAGGAYIAWFDSAAVGSLKLHLVRIAGASVPAPGWTLPGVVVRNAPGDDSGWPPAVLSDGTGGAYVAWAENVAGLSRIRMQRIVQGGAVAAGWPADGLLLNAVANQDAYHPRLVGDGAGGAYVAWSEGTDGTFVTHVLPGGTIAPGAWGARGTHPSPAYADAYSTLALVPDTRGGVIASWMVHNLVGGIDAVMVQRLMGDGSVAPGWPEDGFLTNGGASEGSQPIASVNRDRVLVAWFRENPTPSDQELVTAVVGLDGTSLATTVPGPRARFALVQPQPTGGFVRALLALPDGGDVTPDVVDLAGRRVRSLPPMRGLGPGVHAIAWDGRDDDGNAVHAGVYLLVAKLSGAASGRPVARIVLAR